MLHLALHFLVPLVVALGFYRRRWRHALLILLATMLVDLDHLLADPIYDPERCSIGFHPLHSVPMIVVYVLMFAMPFVIERRRIGVGPLRFARAVSLAGLGLLIHMALDAIDCLV